MPRKPRIDEAGLLNHVMSRGIEKRRIFEDDGDRKYFLVQLSDILLKENAKCYGWVLMPNHFHLVMVTGKKGLAKIMRQLLTRYAIYFNHKYKRSGHLFQNRYKSIVCEKDDYLLELVAYVHLNPLRAAIVKDVEDLSDYIWSGHNVVVGKDHKTWQSRDEVLSYFGDEEKEAIKKYLIFLKERANRKKDLNGGGLIRSTGGVEEAMRLLKSGNKQMYDERILGSGEFVESILKKEETIEGDKDRFRKKIIGIKYLIQKIADKLGIEIEELRTNSKREKITKARSLISYLGQAYLGEKGVVIGSELGKTGASVSIAYRRGKELLEKDEESKEFIDHILRF